jgi:hypothetical protein
MYASGKLFDVYFFPESSEASAGWGWLGEGADSSQARLLGHVNISLEFWNIGAQGNNIYGVTEWKDYGLTSADYYGFGTVKFQTVYEGEQFPGWEIYNTEGYRLGNFSGGPQGIIEPDWMSDDLYKEKWPIVNGNFIVIGFKSNSTSPPPADAEIPITNYKAFENQPGTSESVAIEKEPNIVEEKLEAPTIKLILKGPFESGGSQNSFIVEAVVTGNPEPTVTFSRDDSGGGMGKYKALINLAPDSWMTFIATAKNSAGEARDQINISTKSQVPTINLKIVEGPDWLTLFLCYYAVEAEVTGFPEPFVVWGTNNILDKVWPAGKNKKYVYIYKEVTENVKVTAYVKNSLGKSESKSLTLSWVDPPADFYKKTQLVLAKSVNAKGKLFIKRADDNNWQEVINVINIYEGDMIKTADSRSGIYKSNSPDPETYILKRNTIFMVTKDGGILEQGSIRVNTGNKYQIKSKYGNTVVKGTDFIFSADENKTTLQVIEGTVDFYSNETGDMIVIKPGEFIDATEQGLGKKGTFDITAEEKYWDDLMQDIDLHDTGTASAEKIPTYAIVLIIVLMLLLCVVLAAAIILLKKYRIF